MKDFTMNESLLHKLSLIISIFGFLFLIIIFLLASPKQLENAKIPQDQEIQFSAILKSINTGPSGSTLQLQRECIETAFIKSEIPDDFQGSVVIVTGKLSGDFFSVSSLELSDR